MPTYKIPGVYREDVFPAGPVELPTGVPVFLGLITKQRLDALAPSLPRQALQTQDGGGVWLVGAGESPLEPGVSGMFTLWPEFEERFGALRTAGYLVRAVRGFFENGGGRCYVQLLCREEEVPPLMALRLGLERLEALDAADLVCAPDIMLGGQSGGSPGPEQVQPMQAAVLSHCDRLGDRFAILDARPGLDRQAVLAQRQGLRGMNGALYYPWVRPAILGGFIPACGHVAGVYARSDRAVGVHKAPANEALEGVLDLEVNVADAVQEELNPAGVNCLRAFPGRGIRVWGARTLADPTQQSEWIYVSVRRLFLTVARRIERGMPWAVLEPNDPRLWARLERELSAYLGDLYRQGAFQGASAQAAFRVKCDAETNPPDVREAGMVVTEIHLAPTVPGEFVVVRIIHGTGGVTVATEPPAAPGVMQAAVPSARPDRQDVRLTHIEYNPEGRDIGGEYVLVRNLGTRPVDMTGWTLHDEAHNTFVFPAFSLAPGASARVWSGRGSDTMTDLYWGRGVAVWNNIGDKGYLRDREGSLVAVYSYSA
ncbi:MAG TPA: lamin tail domain-containing protein [Candidatus Methylomirabilis sp.]|nr:lamin tail domain-containing protein [Candidatus Methylomirabilis sp.]